MTFFRVPVGGQTIHLINTDTEHSTFADLERGATSKRIILAPGERKAVPLLEGNVSITVTPRVTIEA